MHTQLLLMTLMRSRLQHLCTCLSFTLRYMAKFYFSRKIRHASFKTVAVLYIVLMPIWIGLFFTSVALYAPLLPLFTLPLFFTGFPRPRRFWPLADSFITSSSSDWVYYDQLTGPLTNQLKDIISTGSLGEVSAGDFFLARFQDRLIWVSVLERGYMHTNIVVKGLELAETSCHTAEAARIDDIFECITKEKPRSVFNPHPLHVLTPCDLVDLSTYSDARNVLTGIIDRPENLASLSKHFVNSLIWVLVRFSKSRRDKGLGNGPTYDEIKERHEELQKKNSFRSLYVNDTRNTNILNPDEDAPVRMKSSSLNSKSSLSDNSMNALWSARPVNTVEPIKMMQLKDHSGFQTSDYGSNGLPVLGTMAKEPRETKLGVNFRGPNIVMDDDFDGFGFDELDDSLPRSKSSNSTDNNENTFPHQRNIQESPIDSDSTPKAYRTEANQILRRKTLPTLVVDVSSPHSSQLEPPSRWKDSIPVESSSIAAHERLFSEDWFKHVLSSMSFEGERVLESISADRGLLFIFRRLAVSCFVAVQEQQQQNGPLDVWKMFNGEFPWSQYSHWLEQDAELREQVLLSYRYVLKGNRRYSVTNSLDKQN